MDFLIRVNLNQQKVKEVFEKIRKAESLLREAYIDMDNLVSASIEEPVKKED